MYETRRVSPELLLDFFSPENACRAAHETKKDGP